jgi:hypothetical protein
MTLKEYLVQQKTHFAKAAQEVKEDHPAYYRFEGRLRAYTDLLLVCPDSLLNKKILD